MFVFRWQNVLVLVFLIIYCSRICQIRETKCVHAYKNTSMQLYEFTLVCTNILLKLSFSNPVVLRMAKSFGRSKCSRVKF